MQINYCPGCNNPKYTTVGQIGKPINLNIDTVHFYQPEYRIRVCLNCGLYYKSHTAEESELSEYYQKVNIQKWQPKKTFPNETVIINALSKLPISSKILDFGCSTGRLLSCLTDQHECFGVEINEEAITIAESKSIQIISNKDILSLSLDKFDAIILCDVFEHLLRPTQILQMLCNNLKPGGFLIVCTGNANAKACQNDIANFWYFRSIEHLCMFSRKYANFVEHEFELTLKNWHEISHYNAGIYEKIFQYIRNFSYWQFHHKKTFISKYFLQLIPFIRRARKWKQAPYFSCSRDHVVAVFQK